MELSVWLTPAILIAVAALLLRSIARLEDRLGARIDGLDTRLRMVEHGQARLEGLLEGLREAIAGRRPAA